MHSLLRPLLVMLWATIFVPSFAQNNTAALIPIPNHIEKSKNGATTQLDKNTTITTSLQGNSFIIQELERIINKQMGLSPAIDNSRNKNRIEIEIDSSLTDREHYTLQVDKKGISIKGGSEGALFMALQTLNQILIGDICNTADKKVEHIKIDDKPRFAHRAVMIDPARHFLPVEDVKFFIDQMARFKFNTLQLHLTDDQGWRIEIKSHPKLTETGAFRTNGKTPSPDNGYYTHDDIKELIAYAGQRNIEIIPELDIPGHSVAILKAYPELGCAFRHNDNKDLGNTTNMMLCAHNKDVYAIYEDIIEEIAMLFPSKKIHLGGDEAAVKENWAKCNDCHDATSRLRQAVATDDTILQPHARHRTQ